MDLEFMKRKYAKMLVTVGMNVQKGQPVLIESAIENWQFANLVAEEAYKIGSGRVMIAYLDRYKMKLDAEYRPVEEVAQYRKWEGDAYEEIMSEKAATIRLESEYPDLMRDLSDEKAHAIFAHTDNLRNIMRGRMRQNGTQWCIACVPNQTWAEKIYPGEDPAAVLTKYWEQIFKLCYLDETNDPVQVWAEKNERHSVIGDKLDSFGLRKLHFTSSNGTDITFGLGKLSKFGMPEEYKKLMKDRVRCNCNIPTEEHCTTPLKYEVDGIVYSTRPLLAGGKMMDKFWIRFEKGKAVECHAEEGEEMLRSIIATDEGSCYLGEIALVPYHSPISMSGLVYYTTLIDENASCHMALGSGLGTRPGYEENGVKDPYNQSSIHIDFMFGAPDTDVTGITEDGKEIPIFRNGDYVI